MDLQPVECQALGHATESVGTTALVEPSHQQTKVADDEGALVSLADDYMWGFESKSEDERRELGLAIAQNRGTDEDIKHFTTHSLLRGVEEWDQMISCATAMKEKAAAFRGDPLAGQDLLTFLSQLVLPHAVEQWSADHEAMLNQHYRREGSALLSPPPPPPPPSSSLNKKKKGIKRKRKGDKDQNKNSPYWANAAAAASTQPRQPQVPAQPLPSQPQLEPLLQSQSQPLPESEQTQQEQQTDGLSRSQRRKLKKMRRQQLLDNGGTPMLQEASTWYRTEDNAAAATALEPSRSPGNQTPLTMSDDVASRSPPSPPPSPAPRELPGILPPSTQQVPAEQSGLKGPPQNESSVPVIIAATNNQTGNVSPKLTPSATIRTPKRTKTSHFFAATTTTTTTTSNPPQRRLRPRPRPPRNTVSALPFPRLDAPRFGLIQEELASDPFRLLIAVTFLIRTHGTAAIPVFRALMDRYPTAEALAREADVGAIADRIGHLGLGRVRAAAVQRYARAWTERPPRAGVRFKVGGGYPGVCEPMMMMMTGGSDVEEGQKGGGEGEGEREEEEDERFADPELDPNPNPNPNIRPTDAATAWEIGHMTQGRYALDSWRIFCRDVLLGRAEDWRGKGASPTTTATGGGGGGGVFQPEWMRVMPEDKELRAYLRWLWMQEGWDWDPKTGEKEVLSPDLLRAVQEGRVEWDYEGGLRILGGGGGSGDGL
ncbi:hypothetical protein SLS62_000187 [Diatrype stigma]|uniref:HhH-GPD domain-containing protein n=1 Tax=Diatrype stigma TaxID=117547 RepID=A0AAN9UY97_9PEZI